MTQIKYGQIISDARGSTAGMTFTRNKSGAVMRTKVKAINRQTTAQRTARFNLGRAGQLWNTLTPVQQLTWNTKAESWLATNKLGDKSRLSGFNLFAKMTEMLYRHNITFDPDFQMFLSSPWFTAWSITRSAVDNTISFDVTVAPDDPVYFTFKMSPLLPLNKPVKGRDIRIIANLLVTDITTVDLTPYYKAVFGNTGMDADPATVRLMSTWDLWGTKLGVDDLFWWLQYGDDSYLYET